MGSAVHSFHQVVSQRLAKKQPRYSSHRNPWPQPAAAAEPPPALPSVPSDPQIATLQGQVTSAQAKYHQDGSTLQSQQLLGTAQRPGLRGRQRLGAPGRPALQRVWDASLLGR